LAQLPRESGKNGQIPDLFTKSLKISLKPAAVFRHIIYGILYVCCEVCGMALLKADSQTGLNGGIPSLPPGTPPIRRIWLESRNI
jgi:hypothetical protein